MNKSRIFLILLLIGLSMPQLLETVYDKDSGHPIGTKDHANMRNSIYQFQESNSSSFSISDASTFSRNLGITEWGVIQVAAYLKVHPSLKSSDVYGALCDISGEDVQSLKMSEVVIDGKEYIYDFEVHDNFVYIMTGYGNLEAIELKPDMIHTSDVNIQTSNLTVSWQIKGFQNTVKNLLGSYMNEACMAHHRKQDAIYIPSDIGLIRVDTLTRNVTSVGNGIYDKKLDIVYCDIIQDILFIASKLGGVFIYNVKDQNSIIKVGVMDSAYFKKNSNETLTINDFVVHNHLVEVIITDEAVLDRKLRPNSDANSIFGTNITLRDYNKELVERSLNTTLMFIAERSKIYVVDVRKIVSSNDMTDSLLNRTIGYAEVDTLKRFDESLIALFQMEGTTSVKSVVSEILILNSNPDDWKSTSTLDDDLFVINTEIPFYSKISNVFVDDRHFYAIASSQHYIYERAVPAVYGIGNFKISNQFVEDDVTDMAKFSINGRDFVVTIGIFHVADFRMVRSDPNIVCPRTLTNPPFGKYTIELNATTRTCPTKVDLQSSYRNKENPQKSLTKVCRWTKTLEIEYHAQPALENTSIMQTLLLVVVCIALIVFACCLCVLWRVRQNNVEYEKLKSQIGNMQLPTQPDSNRDNQDKEAPQLESEKMNVRVGRQKEQIENVDYGDENT